jgi:hypothetical protein
MSSHYGIPVRQGVHLPNEVLYEIFHNLPASFLVVIACVSHRFNAVAEHILYSFISCRDVLSDSSPSPWRTKLCCESIMRRAHLVETIRGLHIRWQADAQSSSSFFVLTPTLLKLTKALHTLSSSSSLESLELWLGPANYPPNPSVPHVIERIIQGSHFPHLISCSLGAEWSKGSPLYSGVLDHFLGSTHLLRHLKLPDHHSTVMNIPPDALPILSSFRGSPATSASLLPGRPIQYLALIGDDYDVNREILARLARTTLPLRVLDLSVMSVRPILLQNLAIHLPAIETLKVRLALRHTLHYALTGIRLLTGLSPVLMTFHRLVHLDLSPTSVAGADAEHELGLCNEWCRACPSLRKITFPSHREWFLGPNDFWLPKEKI